MLDDSLPESDYEDKGEENASADEDDADDEAISALSESSSSSSPSADGPSSSSADESLPSSLAAELLTEAQAREDALAARVRLGLEAVAALRSAQAPADGEEVDRVDHRAIGAALRRYLVALGELAPHLGRWAPAEA